MPFQYRGSSTDSYDSGPMELYRSKSHNMTPQYTAPGQYPPFTNRFQSLQQAEDWISFREAHKASPGIYPFEYYRQNFQTYAEEVYQCMVNMQELRETTSNSHKNFSDNKIEPSDIEATAVLLVHAWIKRHEIGPLQAFSKVPVADRELGMEDRLKAICHTLKICKLNCEDAMKKGKLEYLVHAPIQALRTKDQNREINSQREPVLKAGNQVLGRQPKRLTRARPTNSGQVTKSSPPSLPLRDYHLNMLSNTNLNGATSFDDYINPAPVTLPSIDMIVPHINYPTGTGHNSAQFRRASRPPDIETRHSSLVDPTLQSPNKSPGLLQFLEPDAHTSIDMLTPTCGGMLTSRGTNFNMNFTAADYSSLGSTHASGADLFVRDD